MVIAEVTGYIYSLVELEPIKFCIMFSVFRVIALAHIVGVRYDMFAHYWEDSRLGDATLGLVSTTELIGINAAEFYR